MISESDDDRPARFTDRASTVLPVICLVIVVALAYANGWPNTLVYDDKIFSDFERFADPSAIPGYFAEDAWAAEVLDSGLYRPMLYVSLVADTNLFGDWFAGYHLVNILLQVLVTVFLFLLLERLLALEGHTGRAARFGALFAAMIFGVHPVLTEAVNSIFNRSILLGALGSLAGLWWLFRYVDSRPVRAWAGLVVAYLFAVFSRESAIVLPGVAGALIFICSDGGWRSRVRRTLPVLILVIPMVLYLVARDHALDGYETGVPKRAGDSDTPTVVAQVAPKGLYDGDRVLEAAGVMAQGIAAVAWPFGPRLLYPGWTRNAEWVAVALHLGLLVLAWREVRRGRRGLAAGLAVYYLAFLPASRLFGTGSLDPHLQGRYLYEPAVGLMILLGYGLARLRARVSPNVAAATVAVVLMTIVPVTWGRNADWGDEVRLFEAEYRRGGRDRNLIRLLTSAHIRAGNFRRVVNLCEEFDEERKFSSSLAVHCATALDYTGRREEAEQMYKVAVRRNQHPVLAHTNLALHYLRRGRWDDARVHFEEAAEAESHPALQLYRRAYMLIHLYPNDRERLLEARRQLQAGLALEPRMTDARDWLRRLDEALTEAGGAAPVDR